MYECSRDIWSRKAQERKNKDFGNLVTKKAPVELNLADQVTFPTLPSSAVSSSQALPGLFPPPTSKTENQLLESQRVLSQESAESILVDADCDTDDKNRDEVHHSEIESNEDMNNNWLDDSQR